MQGNLHRAFGPPGGGFCATRSRLSETPMPKLESTKETLALAAALEARGVRVEVEHWDGHKHIDIFVPDAKLYIEIDGLQHYINPKQIRADLLRDHYSDDATYSTKRFSNQIVKSHLGEIADAIAEIAIKEIIESNEAQERF